MVQFKHLYSISCAVLLAGCMAGPDASAGGEAESLPEAAVEITVDQRNYRLETWLWRDFMPRIGTPQKRGLIALAWVTAVDGKPMDPGLSLDGIWIRHGDEVWKGEFSGEPRGKDPARDHQLESIARDGPEWPTGARVTVVVRVLTSSGETYYLRADAQLIHRTA